MKLCYRKSLITRLRFILYNCVKITRKRIITHKFIIIIYCIYRNLKNGAYSNYSLFFLVFHKRKTETKRVTREWRRMEWGLVSESFSKTPFEDIAQWCIGKRGYRPRNKITICRARRLKHKPQSPFLTLAQRKHRDFRDIVPFHYECPSIIIIN